MAKDPYTIEALRLSLRKVSKVSAEFADVIEEELANSKISKDQPVSESTLPPSTHVRDYTLTLMEHFRIVFGAPEELTMDEPLSNYFQRQPFSCGPENDSDDT